MTAYRGACSASTYEVVSFSDGRAAYLRNNCGRLCGLLVIPAGTSTGLAPSATCYAGHGNCAVTASKLRIMSETRAFSTHLETYRD